MGTSLEILKKLDSDLLMIYRNASASLKYCDGILNSLVKKMVFFKKERTKP